MSCATGSRAGSSRSTTATTGSIHVLDAVHELGLLGDPCRASLGILCCDAPVPRTRGRVECNMKSSVDPFEAGLVHAIAEPLLGRVELRADGLEPLTADRDEFEMR